MTTADAPEPARGASECANCGTVLVGAYCHACGQSGDGRTRLVVRDVLTEFCEHLLDFDSAFLRTFAGLTVRPGGVCRDYVAGRRKRYMNPFGYLLLSGTVNLALSGLAGWMAGPGAPADPDEPDSGLVTWFLLALLVPLAVLWRWLFRRSGFNLAENYVFALFIMSQYTWLETLILVPLTYLVSETTLTAAYFAIWLCYLVFAGTGFYGRPWWLVLLKMLAAHLFLIVAGLVAMIVWALIDPSTVET
jgi:hypothetical protein